MRFDVLTLFPEMFSGYLSQSLLHKAIQAGLVEVGVVDPRSFAKGKHKKLDDRPFGGGPGMVLMAEPIVECVERLLDWQSGTAPDGTPLTLEFSQAFPAGVASTDVPPPQVGGKTQLILLSPQGARLDQARVRELARWDRLVLLCGRYEGFDDRVRQVLQPLELSIGDYVLNGGEVAAMVVIDSVIRFIPGVLGDEESSQLDSFSGQAGLLEFPQFTRPRVFRGLHVPQVLLDGDHAEIEKWRQAESRRITAERRPDLLSEPDQ